MFEFELCQVDEWHTDSTDYVFVLILSDTTDMEGGELKVDSLSTLLMRPRCSNWRIRLGFSSTSSK